MSGRGRGVARPGDRRVVPFPVERVQAAAAPPAVADTRAPAPRRNGHALALVALVVVLNLTGLVMVLSASAAASQETYGTPWYQFQRQLLWLGLGTAALLVVTRIDLQRLRRPATTILAVTVGLLVAVLVPGLGTNVNGSSRWLGAGPVSIQPSELAKLALVLFVADLLARRARRVHDLRLTLRPVLVVFGLVAALVMLQPNLGTTMLLFAIVVSMLFVAGVPGKPLALTAGVGVAVAGLFALAEPYRFRRLLAFTDPWADPLNTGYQTLQSRAALANGGTVGQGLGQGRAKFGFLPEGHTDFIFANIGEELGLIGALVLLGLFVAVAVVGMSVAMRAPDRFGTLVAAGVTTWILAQAFVNLGAVVGVLPITGVPLPFVSFGGSSLVVTMAAYGMLLHVARQLR